MKERISITLEEYQVKMLKEIETYINEETDLYLPNRSTLIGFIIQKIQKNKEILVGKL